jgi:hypothetical protein
MVVGEIPVRPEVRISLTQYKGEAGSYGLSASPWLYPRDESKSSSSSF